jgi:uncharacterized protein YkwD
VILRSGVCLSMTPRRILLVTTSGAGAAITVAATVLLGCASAYVAALPRPSGASTIRDEHLEARQALLSLINADRMAYGASPVVLDSLATMVAQVHAAAMAGTGFASHYGTAGDAPYERYAAAGGTAHVRENVFAWRTRGAPLPDERRRIDPALVHGSLMGSSGHRATILDPHRTGVGIGIAWSAEGTSLVVVEEFLAHHAAIVTPRLSWGSSPPIVVGRLFDPELEPLLVILSREPDVRDWVARGEPPPDGPYLDGGEGTGILVPPWAFETRRDGSFEVALPLGGVERGRWYGIVYVAPAEVVRRSIAGGRVSSAVGWPGAAFLLDVL